MRGKKSLLFAVAFCVSAAASPAFHNYEFAGFPKGASDCTEIGKNLAAKFEKVTTIIPTGFKSSQDTPDTCRVKITYAAEKSLSLVTTAPRHPIGGEGSYESYSACESARVARTKQFEDMTGLTAVLSYCQLANRETNRPYIARIESFGKPKISLQFSDHVVDFGRAFVNASQVELQIAKNFARHGLPLAEVALRGFVGGSWFNYLYFSYYANQPRTFEILRPFVYSTPSACETSAAMVSSYFDKANVPLFGGFCTSQYGNTSINFLIERPLSLSITTPPEQETYESWAACESDRNRVENAFSKIGWSIFGTICGRANNRYEMLVFGRGPNVNYAIDSSRRPLPWTNIVNANRMSFSESSARYQTENDIRSGIDQKRRLCASDKGRFSSYGGFVSCSKLGSQYTCRANATCVCNKPLKETDESRPEDKEL